MYTSAAGAIVTGADDPVHFCNFQSHAEKIRRAGGEDEDSVEE